MRLLILLVLYAILFSISSYPQYILPEWAKGIVWYQIFPERFANGDKNNDPAAEKIFLNDTFIPPNWKVSEWNSNWFEQAEWKKNLGRKFRDHIFHRRYGGDIQGIIDYLDHHITLF